MASTAKKLKTGQHFPRLKLVIDTQEGFVKSFDGTRIWYKSMGKGVPIVFCNGLGCSTFYWKHIYNHYRKTNQVVLFDWRGHGQSSTPLNEKNISLAALVEDLHAVIKKLKLKKVVLAGHSMGVQAVFSFYAKYPAHVLALIPCFGTFARPLDTFYNSQHSKYIFSVIYAFNHLFPKLANSLGHLMGKNPFWFQMGSALGMMNAGLADKKVLKEYIDHFTHVESVFLAKLAMSMQEHSAEPVLKKIKIPTLIFAAEDDTFTPVWISKKMHHLIKDSEIFVIKNASHVALIEQPALINLRIEKFVNERL